MSKKKLWLTYAWKDNEDKDIDFIVQELDKAGIDVRFDRRNLVPGQRLWTQIGGAITDPAECDAWGIILTANSVGSESCIEELSYALDRALNAKGDKFPIFALLHDVSAKSLPPVLKIRLCIPLGNNDWVRQTQAAVEGSAPGLPITGLDQWIIEEHPTQSGYALEIRPRFDRISPFAVAVDLDEKTTGNVTNCSPGPANMVPSGHVAFNWIDSQITLTDGTSAWVWGGNNEANSTASYYLFYKKRPRRVWFGHQQNLKLVTFQ
jgi:hypothetical protein